MTQENPQQQPDEVEVSPEMAENIEKISRKMKDWMPVISDHREDIQVFIKKVMSKCNRNRANRLSGKRSWPCKGCPMWHGECILDVLQRWKEVYENGETEEDLVE